MKEKHSTAIAVAAEGAAKDLPHSAAIMNLVVQL